MEVCDRTRRPVRQQRRERSPDSRLGPAPPRTHQNTSRAASGAKVIDPHPPPRADSWRLEPTSAPRRRPDAEKSRSNGERLPDADARAVAREALQGAAARSRARAPSSRSSWTRLTGTLQADAEPLAQAMGNLLDNPVRHGAPPFRLISTGNDVVSISIIDSGCAPPELEPHRLEPSAKTGLCGETGLGLCLGQEMAWRRRGAVAYPLRARQPAAFELRLPATPLIHPVGVSQERWVGTGGHGRIPHSGDRDLGGTPGAGPGGQDMDGATHPTGRRTCPARFVDPRLRRPDRAGPSGRSDLAVSEGLRGHARPQTGTPAPHLLSGRTPARPGARPHHHRDADRTSIDSGAPVDPGAVRFVDES